MRIGALLVIFIQILTYAQFDGPGGELGSKSIFKDNSSIIGWATGAQLVRGPIQINDKALGLASVGTEASALGSYDGDVVSLGDGGSIILSFDQPIINREGYDFATFENGFQVGFSYYLELAHVEVSKDGKEFKRFPNKSLTDTSYQTNNFSYTNPYQLHNFAGKHQAPYGTLFDIDELGFDTINYIQLIDVVGSVNDSFGTRDIKGRMINDPFPSPYESCGFDLDAVALVNGELLNTQRLALQGINVYPTLVYQNEPIHIDAPVLSKISVVDIQGREINFSRNQDAVNISSIGTYFLHITHQGKSYTQKICVR
jgi:hypothetical protein